MGSPRSEATLVLGDDEILDLGLDLQDLMTEVDEERMRQLGDSWKTPGK